LRRHRFDPFSLLFGALFVGVGISFLLGSTIVSTRHSLWPVLAIAVGCTFVAWAVVAIVRDQRSATASAVTGPPDVQDDGS
jgi:hypothetical protein